MLAFLSGPSVDARLRAATDRQAQFHSAAELTRQFSEMTGVDRRVVFGRLTTIDLNLLALLGSPQGWTAIAAFMACELGISAPDLVPTVH
ncbi:hypothetical protein U8326_10045 [Tsuneonella sp. CC-YZS046]|uniref:hypothetical protein n=1 Tax=Tsuneonella sp. CC-YZS046 TaxID=3042152 RepID=UPI002D795D69|nr:hypothetical protein [Tsuneonella sp. CC-YZS046]WRO65402.1 hypothetical protein U8326_10045 [Tsuneonella sp. CC-YZS046]